MTVDSESLTVLLVEDNPNDARLIKRYLSDADTAFLPAEIEIQEATDLDAGRKRLSDEEIDLLLLDLGLQKSSGTETFNRIKDETGEIPVIVLTGLQDEEAAVDLLQRGAQDYLNKGSLDSDRLVKSLRYAIERQDRERKLKQTTQRLEVLNRILRHDLKNDIQLLTIWIETIAGEVEQAHDEYLEKILARIDHMEELTENSKQLMELVSGDGDNLTRKPVSLHELFVVELEKARSSFPDAAFSLDSQLKGKTVEANEILSSAIRNILNNAVQHSDKPTPAVDIVMREREGSAVVAVADNGPGIPDKQKDNVFGKGQKGPESSGTGIGLYLVHRLVTEFDGTVWVEDREDSETLDRIGKETNGPGSVFCIELDLCEG